ncbi:hypothetical protein OPQ81_007799 [Rhizoctonia solani]|nr:hypothetical protein OPQ81_007799 [Rhizoctonia solani]
MPRHLKFESDTTIGAMHELKNLTPIDTLPDELLLRIFSILIGWDAINCGHWDGKRLWNRDKRICQDWTRHATVISRVNKSWRRLAINTSSFWSHIDLFFEHGYWLPLSGAFRRCLARVKDAPIELHINCGQMQRFYTTAVVIPSCILRDRTVTSLIVTASYPALIQPIVGAYLNEATCSSLTKLQVEFISPEQSVVCVPAPEQPNQQQLFENLLRLNTLRLSGASMNWASARFSGLVELQLCNMQISPSMDQIYDILAASPELCTVELDRLHPTSYVLTGSRSKSRIKLPKLSYLHLGGKVYDFVDRLLQVIEPGIGQLCLKLSILEASSNELESLRIWNNVSILSLSVPGLPATLLSQMLSQKGTEAYGA